MDKPLDAREWHDRLAQALALTSLSDSQVWELAAYLAAFDTTNPADGDHPSRPIAQKLLELSGTGPSLAGMMASELQALDLNAWLVRAAGISAIFDQDYATIFRAAEKGNLPIALGGVKVGPDGTPSSLAGKTGGDRYFQLAHLLYARLWKSQHDRPWRQPHWPPKY